MEIVPIPKAIEDQVRRTPRKIALAANDLFITYNALNRRANRIAWSFLKKGVGQGDIIAVALPRGFDFFAAVIGIMKSGAAYLPLNVDAPTEANEYKRWDSGAIFTVTAENIGDLRQEKNAENPGTETSNERICCCLYIAGGYKKTLVAQGYLSDMMPLMENYYSLHLVEGGAISAPVSFDVFTLQILFGLVFGKTSFLIGNPDKGGDGNFESFLKKNPEKRICSPPSFLETKISADADKFLNPPILFKIGE